MIKCAKCGSNEVVGIVDLGRLITEVSEFRCKKCIEIFKKTGK